MTFSPFQFRPYQVSIETGQVHYPLTASTKIWNDTLVTLAKCATEGLKKSYIESEARKRGRAGDAAWGSIKWTRELLQALSVDEDRISELVEPLVEVQRLRSKLGAHTGGTETAAIRRDLLKEFGTPRAHIEALAARLSVALDALESILK